MIKLDVVSGELNVLATRSKMLEARGSRWIVEVHSALLAAAVRGIFEHGGYSVDAGEPRHHAYPDNPLRYIVGWPP